MIPTCTQAPADHVFLFSLRLRVVFTSVSSIASAALEPSLSARSDLPLTCTGWSVPAVSVQLH